MLARGRYPWSLKQRIAGPLGHLDNFAAADLLRQVAGHRLRHVVAAHLSEENNTPALARAALAGALGCSPDWVSVADQARGCDWRSLD
jgi:phosphoribosyl 1,2-cyclic phosphodiesterase